jgi:hypothetical protein
MLGYLNITRLTVALLLNFKNSRLEWKRIVNERAKWETQEPSSAL